MIGLELLVNLEGKIPIELLIVNRLGKGLINLINFSKVHLFNANKLWYNFSVYLFNTHKLSSNFGKVYLFNNNKLSYNFQYKARYLNNSNF